MSDEQDWFTIRADYEQGLSLRALAAKYGVSKSVIGDRKYREHWTQERTDDRTAQNTQEVKHPDVNAAVRAATGFKLRYEEQLTWEEVAIKAGYASRGAAKNAVDREALRHVSRDIQEARDIENYRLTQLQTRCYKAGMDKANDAWTWAIDRYVALSKRRSELMGLDVKPDAIPDGVTIIREYGVEVSKV
jgi:hypothetical protein